MLWGTSALGLAPQARDPKDRPWQETGQGRSFRGRTGQPTGDVELWGFVIVEPNRGGNYMVSIRAIPSAGLESLNDDDLSLTFTTGRFDPSPVCLRLLLVPTIPSPLSRSVSFRKDGLGRMYL